MVERVLVPVDDPSQTRVAIDLALALAAPLNAGVTLFHVLDTQTSVESEAQRRRTDTGLSAKPLDPLTSTGNPQIEEDETAARPPVGPGDGDAGSLRAEQMTDEDADMARHVLETIAADNAGGAVPVAVAIGKGSPAKEILKMAHTAPFDLIVMETRRSSAVARMVMGSTADEVARSSQAPVMLIHPQSSDGRAAGAGVPRNIIVPLDRSHGSEHVVPLAQELAKALSCNLTFLNVQTPASEKVHAGSRAVSPHRQGARAQEHGGAAYMDELVKASSRMGLQADSEAVSGDLYSAIEALIKSLERPLVVINASDKSGFSRLLTGSLPDRVARQSGAPVLMVPERLGSVID